MPHYCIAALDHLPGDIGMVVEAENDRHVGAQNLAAEGSLLAFYVVDALGGAGAVKLQREAVDPPSR